MRRVIPPVLVALTLLLLVAVPVSAAGVSKSELHSKALSISNMPTGWSVDNSNTNSGEQGCLSGLKTSKEHQTKVTVAFEDGSFPEVQEVLATGRGASADYATLDKALSHCTTYSVTSGGAKGTVSVGAMSFPTVGQKSAAYALNITLDGVSAGADLVLFETDGIFGAINYEDLGTPDSGQAQGFVTEAVAKVEGKPTTTPTTF